MEDDLCSICLTSLPSSQPADVADKQRVWRDTKGCRNQFHATCISAWCGTGWQTWRRQAYITAPPQFTCPVCRGAFSASEVARLLHRTGHTDYALAIHRHINRLHSEKRQEERRRHQEEARLRRWCAIRIHVPSDTSTNPPASPTPFPYDGGQQTVSPWVDNFEEYRNAVLDANDDRYLRAADSPGSGSDDEDEDPWRTALMRGYNAASV